MERFGRRTCVRLADLPWAALLVWGEGLSRVRSYAIRLRQWSKHVACIRAVPNRESGPFVEEATCRGNIDDAFQLSPRKTDKPTLNVVYPRLTAILGRASQCNANHPIT